MAKTQIDKNTLFKVGAGFAAYFIIIRPLLQKLNIIDNKDDRIVNEAATLPGFNPSFWKEAYKTAGVIKIAALSITTTTKFAKQFATALKGNPVEVNEESVNDVFKRLISQVQLSQISDLYSRMFNSDLYGDLKSKLSSNEFAQDIERVKKYAIYHPEYK